MLLQFKLKSNKNNIKHGLNRIHGLYKRDGLYMRDKLYRRDKGDMDIYIDYVVELDL